MKYLITIGILLLLCGFWVHCGWAEDWTDEQIAYAIFLAEGGYKSAYLYGIVSVPYGDEAEAKRICLSTIRNQRIRHGKHECELEYLECLANRYAPIGVSNDPSNLNVNWLKNVKYFLNKEFGNRKGE